MSDISISCEAMSPGEFKQKGEGLTITYGFHPSPFGECFIAITGRGICALSFHSASDKKKVLREFVKKWLKAKLNQDRQITGIYVRKIFTKGSKGRLHLLCGGTDFQLKVWEALLKIPRGTAVSYKNIAEAVGSPGAVRAVGTAIGNNPIAYLIPCHRVIRGMGHWGGYRWGLFRKKAMLGIETNA